MNSKKYDISVPDNQLYYADAIGKYLAGDEKALNNIADPSKQDLQKAIKTMVTGTDKHNIPYDLTKKVIDLCSSFSRNEPSDN